MPPQQSEGAPMTLSSPSYSASSLAASTAPLLAKQAAATSASSAATASAPSSPTHAAVLPTILGAGDNLAGKKRETVIIFDWDDTLLASSFLSGRGYRLDSEMIAPDVEAQLRELETSVIACLQVALQYGEVHVITNAETGWVQLSAQKFIPRVMPLLSQVKVMSARSTYEGMFPEAPLKWKYYAMHEKLSALFGQLQVEKNIISFGDSHVEREAVRAVTRSIPLTLCKSVKFAERPSMEQLRRQIELVTSCFLYIHNHQGDLDLQLTVTVNSNPTEQQQPQQQPAATTQAQPPVLSPPSCMFPQNAMSDENSDMMMQEDKPVAC